MSTILTSIKYIFLFSFLSLSCAHRDPTRFDVLPGSIKPQHLPKKKFGIVITAFNRPEYLKRTLESLSKSHLEDAIVVIVDDSSTNEETIALINNFKLKETPLVKLRHSKNYGVLSGLLHGFDVVSKSVDFILNLDSDVIMNRHWLAALEQTYNTISDPNVILTGFNTRNHKTLQCTENWCEKKSLGGLNFFMSSSFYESHFLKWFAHKDVLKPRIWKQWDWIVVEYMKTWNFKFYATRPSVLQHIGIEGLNSSIDRADIADDFIED